MSILESLIETIRIKNSNNEPAKTLSEINKKLREVFATASLSHSTLKELLERDIEGVTFLHLVAIYSDNKFLEHILEKAPYIYWGITATQLELFINAFQQANLPNFDNLHFTENHASYLRHFSNQSCREKKLLELLNKLNTAITKKELLETLETLYLLFIGVASVKQKEVENIIITHFLSPYQNISNISILNNGTFHPSKDTNFIHQLLLDKTTSLITVIRKLIAQFSQEGINQIAHTEDNMGYSTLSLSAAYSSSFFIFFTTKLEKATLTNLLTKEHLDCSTAVHLAAGFNIEALEIIIKNYSQEAYLFLDENTAGKSPLKKAIEENNEYSIALIHTVLGNFTALLTLGYQKEFVKNAMNNYFNTYYLIPNIPHASKLVREFYRLPYEEKNYFLDALSKKLNLVENDDASPLLEERKKIARKLITYLREGVDINTDGIRDLFALVIKKTFPVTDSEEISTHREYGIALKRILADYETRGSHWHYSIFNIRNPYRPSTKLITSIEKQGASLFSDRIAKKHSDTPWHNLHVFVINASNRESAYEQEAVFSWFCLFFAAKINNNLEAFNRLSDSFHRPRKRLFSGSKTDTQEAEFKYLVAEAYLAEEQEFNNYVVYLKSLNAYIEQGSLLIVNLQKVITEYETKHSNSSLSYSHLLDAQSSSSRSQGAKL